MTIPDILQVTWQNVKKKLNSIILILVYLYL